MKVIATKMGFFGSLRQPGESFDVPDGSKASWYAPADAAPKQAKPAKAKDEPKALSELARGSGKTFNEVHDKNDLA